MSNCTSNLRIMNTTFVSHLYGIIVAHIDLDLRVGHQQILIVCDIQGYIYILGLPQISGSVRYFPRFGWFFGVRFGEICPPKPNYFTEP